MSIAVNFYEFSKRENSTKRPVGTGTTANCNLKDGCGVIAPVIEINYYGNPTGFNYAYIPDFDRYYFVSDWRYYRGLWSATLSVDALASWKDSIGASTQYVLRSSHEYNGDVVDNLYPLKAVFDYNSWEFSNPFVDAVSAGCFALKVVNDSSNVGPRTYLVNYTNFGSLMNYLYSTIDWADIDPSEISIELQKCLINPFQYIVSCAWIPLPYSEIWGGGSTIRFGYWDSEVDAKLIPAGASANGDITVSLVSHPDVLQRGNYLNMEPYTRRSIYFPVIGMIPLDCSMLSGVTAVKLSWHIDVCTGAGTLEIFALHGSEGTYTTHLINTIKYQAGVPIAVSQISTDIIGAASNMMGAIASGASAFMGNVAGGITGAVSGIGNAIQSMMPQPQTNGLTGSFADYLTSSVKIPKLLSQYAKPVDDDNDDRGRPLCAKRVLSTLPGYLLIADPDISIPATAEENVAIKNYLEGGFFYE